MKVPLLPPGGAPGGSAMQRSASRTLDVPESSGDPAAAGAALPGGGAPCGGGDACRTLITEPSAEKPQKEVLCVRNLMSFGFVQITLCV